MRSIEARFRSYRGKHPVLGDFVVLGRAIEAQKFSEKAIRTAFYRLVSREDYSPADKQALIKHLLDLNTLEDGKNKE